MFKILLILFALGELWAAPAPVEFSPKNTPYELRLQMLQEMGEEVGRSSFCPTGEWARELKNSYPHIEKIGLLGGIFLNTSWQRQTERHQSGVWAVPNSSLTVDVYGYFTAWRAKQSCAEADFLKENGLQKTKWRGESFSKLEVCEAWYDYFKSPAEAFSELQALLWRAHSLSLLHVWAYNKEWYQKQLAQNQIAKEDYLLWNAWNQVVAELLPKFNVISCGELMFPLREVAMPYCHYNEQKLWHCQEREPLKDPLLELYALAVEAMIAERKTEDLKIAIDQAFTHLRVDN